MENELKKYLQSLGISNKYVEEILNAKISKDANNIRSKVEFLKSFFGYDDQTVAKMLSNFPNLLTLESSNIEKKCEAYCQMLGIGKSQFAQIASSQPRILSYDLEKNVANKIEKLAKFFRLSKEQVKKNIVAYPPLLSFDLNERLNEYCKFYDEYFHVSKAEFAEMFRKRPGILGIGIDLAKQKVAQMAKMLKIDEEKAKELFVSTPSLLSLDASGSGETSVQNKLLFYKTLFNLSDEQLAKFIKKSPSLLNYDTISLNPTSVLSKIQFFKEFFGVDEDETLKMILKYPKLLDVDVATQSKTSFQKKFQTFVQIFDLSEQQTKEIVKKYPAIAGAKMETVKLKFDNIVQVLGKEEAQKVVKNNPKILSPAPQDIVLRYKLACVIGAREVFLKKEFLTDAAKVWARWCFLKEKEVENKIPAVFRGENDFVGRFHASTDELMKKYPFDSDAKSKVETAFSRMEKIH